MVTTSHVATRDVRLPRREGSCRRDMLRDQPPWRESSPKASRTGS
jgi:hypothetical protein